VGVSKAAVSKVVASKVVVVKKAVTASGKLMHEADSKVMRYIPSLPWNSNLFETMAHKKVFRLQCSLETWIQT
jgi:hypothetical protein